MVFFNSIKFFKAFISIFLYIKDQILKKKLIFYKKTNTMLKIELINAIKKRKKLELDLSYSINVIAKRLLYLTIFTFIFLLKFFFYALFYI
jgi:hypothetical protein